MTALLLVAVLVSVAVTWSVRRVAMRFGLFDRPSHRGAHDDEVPRLGGIAIFAPVALAAATGRLHDIAFLLECAAVIAAIGLIDDLSPMPVWIRLTTQFVTATAVVVHAWPQLGAVWAFLHVPFSAPMQVVYGAGSALWLVWMTNLYNFMDGIDGLAGGQALVAAGALAVVTFRCGRGDLAVLCVALAGGAAGFLAFNFPPARIFMGDVGSTTLGFVFGSIPFFAPGTPVSIPLVGAVLSLFVLDATVTLLLRVARRERWFEAHGTHFYQRAVWAGLSHRAVTLRCYAGMSVLVVAAFIADPQRRLRTSVAVAVVVFTAFLSFVRRVERRGVRAAPGSVAPPHATRGMVVASQGNDLDPPWATRRRP